MGGEDRVNKVNIREMFLTEEKGVLATPAESCNADFEVGVFGAEDGEKGFYDGGCD